jgi:hypothetical protein
MFNWKDLASFTAEQTRQAFGDALLFRRWGVMFIGGAIHYA